MARSDNMRGAVLMVGSMAAFTFGDACMKAIGHGLPLSQSLTLRALVSTGFLAVLAWRMGALRVRLSPQDRAMVALRSGAEAAAAICFFNALFNMPFANVSALLQMLPLTITLGSALIFRESVGWRRWTAIAIGFAGMLLIVRPGTDGFNVYTLSALGAVACATTRDLATRRMSAAVPSITATFVTSCAVLIMALVWSLWQDWQPVSAGQAALLGGAAMFIIAAYGLSVMVMRVGEIGFVAPFRYTSLVLSLTLGWIIFGEWPATLSLIGAAVIVGTGLFTLWRETRVRR